MLRAQEIVQEQIGLFPTFLIERALEADIAWGITSKQEGGRVHQLRLLQNW